MKIKVRVIVGIMMFLGYFLIYIARYNLSVHILDMTRITNLEIMALQNPNVSSITRSGTDTRQGLTVGILYLDDWKIGLLFSAYHVGYCICFPIFHNVGDRLGPTWIVGIAGIISGIANCLTPAAAHYKFWLLFGARTVKGFCAGAMTPSMVQLLRHWVPPVERHYFMWAYCGITAGTFSTFLLCAAMQYCSRWPVGFYFTGGLQVSWAVMWLFVVADYPLKHPFIDRDELVYLNNTIGSTFTIKLTNCRAPWRHILKSVPFWALCTFNFGYAWLITSVCIHGPIYYTRVVRYSIYSASVLTALPFLLRLILGTSIIQLFHWYKHNEQMQKVKTLRKFFIVISHVLPGILLCCLWAIPVVPGPILITMAVALTAAGMDLTLDLCYELSPTFFNSINTVIKIIGNIPGIIVSLSVGAVTSKLKNYSYVWKHIWCFHASVLLLSGIIFLIWGETEVQPWNHARESQRPTQNRLSQRQGYLSNIMEVDEDDYSTRPASRKSGSLVSKHLFLPGTT